MPKRILQGTVTSDFNAKTVTVSVERRFKHPVLKKTVRRTKKYRAHDEANEFRVGDTVRIRECAPISKSKRWEVLERIGRIPSFMGGGDEDGDTDDPGSGIRR